MIQIFSIKPVSICNSYATLIFSTYCHNRIIPSQFINVIANCSERNMKFIRKVFHLSLIHI